jgi:hypothetical protein
MVPTPRSLDPRKGHQLGPVRLPSVALRGQRLPIRQDTNRHAQRSQHSNTIATDIDFEVRVAIP